MKIIKTRLQYQIANEHHELHAKPYPTLAQAEAALARLKSGLIRFERCNPTYTHRVSPASRKASI
jgi:hypothetical protein